MGGFGWVAREAGLCFKQDKSIGVETVYFTGNFSPTPGLKETRSHGIPLIFAQESWQEYLRAVQVHAVDLLVTVDYRPNYDFPLAAFPGVPVINWVQDPRPDDDVQKVNSLHIPGVDAAYLQGIDPIDCRSFAEVVRRSDAVGRAVLFASPAPQLIDKAMETYGVTIPELSFLPYILDFDPGAIHKSERPRIVFLGRLDPIKRPWVFVEVARHFPDVEFVLLGQSHFQGQGAWQPDEVPSNVRFSGHVEGEEKRRLLASAWILVNTSIHEALPVSFLEALLFEMPIVSCQNPEGLVSRFGVYTGRWDGSGLEGVPLFVQGIQHLLEDDHLRVRLGKEGSEWVYSNHGRPQFLSAFQVLCARAMATKPVELPSVNHHRGSSQARPEAWGTPTWFDQRHQAKEQIAAVVPPKGAFILVDDNTWGCDLLPDRTAIPFLEKDGQYWGPPPDDEIAVREIERLRRAGVSFAVFASPAFWWLDYYSSLHNHLRQNYSCILENERLVVFDLKPLEDG